MQAAQYRNYPQATTRSPHASASRRGPGPIVGAPPPHAAAAAAAQQLQMQQAADAHRRELGKRLARKPTDKNLPEGIEDIVIGDAVQEYRKLRDVERRLDSVMMRKRLDMSDSVNRSMTRYRTMRIWISNTAENQPWQQGTMDADAFDFTSDNNASYKVKIEGRLLDDDDDGLPEDEDSKKEADGDAEKDLDAMDQDGDDATKTAAPKPHLSPQRTKLSHFFKSIVIDFDRSKHLQPDGFQQIEWKRPEQSTASEANFDCLEFERKSDENMNVTINLVRDDQPERFKLSKPLAELLDTDEDERANVMMGIWNYIKAQNLQEDEDTRRVQCDARLKAVFSTDSIFFPHLPQYITAHLAPVPALQLPYTIRVDQSYISPASTPSSAPAPAPSAPTIYDILVPVPDPFRESLTSIMRSPLHAASLRQIAALDEHLAATIQAVAHAKAKHQFFTSLSKDPVGFVRRWTSSQRRDLEVIMGEATRGGGENGEGEEWRRGGEEGVWGGAKARESVGLWLARPKTH